MLSRFVDYSKTVLAIRRKVVSALVYPAILLSLCIGLVCLMFFYIIPKFREFIDTLGGDLPLPTQILMDTSTFLASNWLLVLVGTVGGVGAFLASRSNPFPPGVPDPGAVPSETPSSSPTPVEVEVRSLRLVSRTTHTYHVGGSCTSDWRMDAAVRIAPSGRVRGRGVARLLAGAACDFPSAQVQARRIVLRVVGRSDGDRLAFRFQTEGVLPVGSQDLGAFVETIERIRFSLPDRSPARAAKSKRIVSSNGDVFDSTTTIRLRR